MFIKAITKVALMSGAGGAGGAIYLTNSLDTPENFEIKRYTLPATSLPSTISSLRDIDTYESYYGCKFVFIDRWGPKETYNYKGFLKQHEKDQEKRDWKALIIKGANNLKEGCTKKQIVTLAFHNGSFGHRHA